MLEGRCRRSYWHAGQPDYEALAVKAGFTPIREVNDDVEPLTQLMRFLGVPQLSLQEAWAEIHHVDLTINGCIEVLAQVVLRRAAGEPLPGEFEKWPIWITDTGVTNIEVARQRGLDRGFSDAVAERVGSRTVMNSVFVKLGLVEKMGEQSSTDGRKLDVPTEGSSEKPWREYKSGDVSEISTGLKKWRTGETNAKAYFESLGYSVSDVSRQNLGYDLEARSPSGEDLFIEVKSIDTPGQPFTMTSNEEATARIRRARYLLVLVHQSTTSVQIAVIEDPVYKLEFSRQCRQWVWECGTYPFVPIRLTFPQ